MLPLYWLTDRLAASPEWGATFDVLSPDEVAEAGADRSKADEREDPSTASAPPVTYPVVSMLDEAAAAKYPDGRVKRTAYKRVGLASRRLVIVLHQMGVERADSSKRWHLTTAHRVISPSGRRLYLHPIDVRLIEANAVDRRPWHGIGIEVAGNFEGTDGAGDWFKPDTFGRGRAGDAQVEACRQEVVALCRHAREFGGVVEAIIPHRVTGRDKRGEPNRQICPGSRIWSQVGEWAGATLGLAVPGPAWKLGGATIPAEWRGQYFDGCTRLL